MALSTAQLASPLIGMPAFAPLVELTKQAFASLPEDSTTRTETHYDLIKNIKNKIPQWVSEQKDAFQINGIDASQLEVIKAEALAYVDKLKHEYQPLSRAIQDPVETQKAWKQRSAKQAENMDAKLATYFDNIVDKILLEYTLSACQSVYWQLEISTKLSNDKTDLKNELNKALEKFAQQINETIISHSPDYKDSKKILHTPRPRQAHNYIQRNIDQILNECLFTAQRKRTALIGMTGTGKTQLATALATECENRKWSLVAWMDGSSKSAITSGLVELARAMEVDTKDEPTEKEIITRLFTKLKSSDWDDRLIIFDNVDDITDLTDLTPDAPGLRVIATTTNSIGWGQQSWQSINVENFRRIDAIRYLLSTTQSYDKATADLIAAKLGDLPLALAQAAATALNEKWSLEQYLFRLEKFSSDDVIHSSPGDPYKNEVSFALLLAKESATNKLKSDVRKEADKIIYVLTLLAASGIPTQ